MDDTQNPGMPMGGNMPPADPAQPVTPPADQPAAPATDMPAVGPTDTPTDTANVDDIKMPGEEAPAEPASETPAPETTPEPAA